jgi:hypothetical protein
MCGMGDECSSLKQLHNIGTNVTLLITRSEFKVNEEWQHMHNKKTLERTSIGPWSP